MNKHKLVLEIGRTVIGTGCTYSELNSTQRRIKYYLCQATAEKMKTLRDTLDANGLNKVIVEATDSYRNGQAWYNSSITLRIPRHWCWSE